MSPEDKHKQLTEIAFRILPSYVELLKQKTLDPDTLDAVTTRIRQIYAGLAPEKEFAAAVNWMSNVVAIHSLDQTPIPNYSGAEKFQVPDLLAIVKYKGHLLPALIEVKKRNDDALKWREDYVQSLKRYADALRMPLLVAWNFANVWTLTDIRHFEKKVTDYHLDFNTALRENLMGEIFGDLMIRLTERVKFFVDANVAEKLPDDLRALVPEGKYRMTITGAGFTVDDKKINLSTALFWAFNTAATRNEVKRLGVQKIRIEHVPLADNMFSLTYLWQSLATPIEGENVEVDWDAVMREPLSITGSEVRRELREGISKGVVKYVLEQVPHTMPDFLSALTPKKQE